MAERYTVVRDFDSNYAVFDKSIQMSIATFTTAEEASKYAIAMEHDNHNADEIIVLG